MAASGLAFKQPDVDKVITVANLRSPHVQFVHMTGIREDHGRAVLSLSVSDVNKVLLLAADGLLSLLVDALLLDPAHPVRSDGRTDFEAIRGPVQRDFAEAIAQLAMYPSGRQVLQRAPTVGEALRQVASEGWTELARRHAESALAALTGVVPHESAQQQATAKQQLQPQEQHLMLSYNWGHQIVIKRINLALQGRTWPPSFLLLPPPCGTFSKAQLLHSACMQDTNSCPKLPP